MNFVYIFAASQILPPNEISEIIGLQPDVVVDRRNSRGEYTWKKGFENKNIEKLERETLQFLSAFSKERLNALVKNASVTLWINLYVGDILQQNLHLSAEFIQTVKDLGIEMDITVMNL